MLEACPMTNADGYIVAYHGCVFVNLDIHEPAPSPPNHHGHKEPTHHGTKVQRHHGTNAPWHKGTKVPWHQDIVEPCHRGTMAPWHRGTVHQGTVAPRHDGTGQQGAVAPWNEGTMAQYHEVTKASWHHGTKAPWLNSSMSPRHRGVMAPWHRGTKEPLHRGTVAPWHQGTKAERHRGTKALRHRGTVAPWHHGTVALWQAGYRVKRDLLQPCNVRMGSSAWHLLLGVGAGARRASMEYSDVRRLGFSNAVDAVGMGPLSTPICPVRFSLQTTVALALNQSAPSRTGRAHATPASTRNATWLILPVVICLSQRLSHACMKMIYDLHKQRFMYENKDKMDENKSKLFRATAITRKTILEDGLIVIDDGSSSGSGTGAVVGDNDAPLTVFKTTSHYDYDHTSYTNFSPDFATSSNVLHENVKIARRNMKE
ncbi:hypothetical protein BC332_33868 [Capsicum chinense]|nr:hypothetical protein BC332_33868 [Capsicum chinense]